MMYSSDRRRMVLGARLGVMASVGLHARSVSWENRVAYLAFESEARREVATINADLADAAGVLDTVRAYFEARAAPVSRSEFMRFSILLHGRIVGLSDPGWAPGWASRVTARDRAAFEAVNQDAEAPDFHIRDVDPSGNDTLAGARDRYYPVLFVDAGGLAWRVFGIDIMREPLRRAAIGRAVASGAVAATPPMELIAAPEHKGRRHRLRAHLRPGRVPGRQRRHPVRPDLRRVPVPHPDGRHPAHQAAARRGGPPHVRSVLGRRRPPTLPQHCRRASTHHRGAGARAAPLGRDGHARQPDLGHNRLVQRWMVGPSGRRGGTAAARSRPSFDSAGPDLPGCLATPHPPARGAHARPADHNRGPATPGRENQPHGPARRPDGPA